MRGGAGNPQTKPEQGHKIKKQGESLRVNYTRHFPAAPSLKAFPWHSSLRFERVALLIGSVMRRDRAVFNLDQFATVPQGRLPIPERGKKVIVPNESTMASTDRLTKGQYRVNPGA